ncbi:MAG: hypothetical protein MRZ16_02085 [Parvimonas sp.]|uniref:hypothetical protein n=1 Tax=Parvimonas sp. TaxID=1944660 RepID=UPI0025D12368|nr:hypothetical protein [Parvimonas sp.]MCI5997008.1 hypothetical protein [Parvimonas sp.]
MKKSFLILLFSSMLLVGCSNSQKEKELQTKVEQLEQKNKELEEKIKKQKEQQKEYERLSKINKYVEDFNAKYNKDPVCFAMATFDEKNNNFNIQLLEQAASDTSGMINSKNNGTDNENIHELWQREITGTALEVSNNLKEINVTVNILHPTDKTISIVSVKDGTVIKDVMK